MHAPRTARRTVRTYALKQLLPKALGRWFTRGLAQRAEAFVRRFDFRPAAIIRKLGLLRPIYRKTTNYGHFGRPGLPWET